MGDLSELLGDLYGTYGSPDPDGPPVRHEPPAHERAPLPDWADDDELDRAFAGWQPGPPPEAPAAERNVLADALSEALLMPDVDQRPLPAPVPVESAFAPEPVDDARTAEDEAVDLLLALQPAQLAPPAPPAAPEIELDEPAAFAPAPAADVVETTGAEPVASDEAPVELETASERDLRLRRAAAWRADAAAEAAEQAEAEVVVDAQLWAPEDDEILPARGRRLALRVPRLRLSRRG